MAKNKNDYFQMLEQQVACCVQASTLLEDILCNYAADKIGAQHQRMHDIEHAADKIHHEIVNKLAVEFMTPIDQEDILRLVQIIDDITDALDEIVMEFYMFHISKVPADAPKMAQVVSRCVNGLYVATKELKNFKKPEMLRSLLIAVNDIESEADDIYMEAIHDLFGATDDAKILMGSKAVYDSLENCCDLCEHAADVIEQIIMKNT